MDYRKSNTCLHVHPDKTCIFWNILKHVWNTRYKSNGEEYYNAFRCVYLLLVNFFKQSPRIILFFKISIKDFFFKISKFLILTPMPTDRKCEIGQMSYCCSICICDQVVIRRLVSWNYVCRHVL